MIGGACMCVVGRVCGRYGLKFLVCGECSLCILNLVGVEYS